MLGTKPGLELWIVLGTRLGICPGPGPNTGLDSNINPDTEPGLEPSTCVDPGLALGLTVVLDTRSLGMSTGPDLKHALVLDFTLSFAPTLALAMAIASSRLWP